MGEIMAEDAKRRASFHPNPTPDPIAEESRSTRSRYDAAKDVFNELNRYGVLWQTRHQWSRTSRFAFNGYMHFTIIVVRNEPGTAPYIIQGQEGVMLQGDTFGLNLYGVTLTLLCEKMALTVVDVDEVLQACRLHRILPICALISISLCLPVLLVSNIKITQNIRHIKHSLESISIGSIPTPSIPALLRIRTLDDLTDESFQELAGDDVPLPRPPSPTKVDPPQEPLTPYSLSNVLETLPFFHDTFAVIVYDPPSDKFIAHYSNNM
ncbi:hypothetical protein ACHAXR_010244, partial [Thalassiosira sp. AJA248-18]